MSTDAGDLGFFEASGTPYEVGVQLGRFGAAIAHRHLVACTAWQTVMAFRDDARVAAMRQMVMERLPICWQELQGLAHGLELPLDDVFLWNCRGDVWAMAPDGCTTVQLPGREPTVAHNEDGDPGFRGHCALARLRPQDGMAFTAFVYPGSIPGHTFAVTETGLVQAVNNIRSRDAGVGLPRMILGRAVLNCPTLDDAIRTIETSERAGGFHFTLAQQGDHRLFSVEFTHTLCSTVRVERPLCHANHLVHDAMTSERQVITGSSAARQRRGDDIIRESNADGLDPLSILWDRGNAILPVHRQQPDDPDGENTLATATFQIGADAVTWQVYDRAWRAPRYSLTDAAGMPVTSR